MKTRNQWRGLKLIVGMLALCVFVISAQSAVLIDEQFESGYNRTVNNIANSNMAWTKGRSASTATVNVGSVSFSAASNQGADGYWGYFTDPTANFLIGGTSSQVSNGHVQLGVGDTITASISMYFSSMPANSTDLAARFALLDNAPDGRSVQDFNGGPASTMFTNNPGFAAFGGFTASAQAAGSISLQRHVSMTSANLMSASGDWRSFGVVGAADNGMFAMTNYTWSVSVYRPDSGTWVVGSEIRDTVTGDLITGGTISTNDMTSTFSWMILRWNRMPDAETHNFTDLKVTVIPEPSTLMLAGAGLALAALAIRRRR